MKWRPFKSFLGKPLNLPNGRAWYEEDILNAERRFVKQFGPSHPEQGEQLPDFDKMLKETPLKTRLKVSNEMAFISLLTELGYREEKAWTIEETEILSRLCKAALDHTEHQLEQIAEYEKDRGKLSSPPPEGQDEDIKTLKAEMKLLLGDIMANTRMSIQLAQKCIDFKDKLI